MRREGGYFAPDSDVNGLAAALDTRKDLEKWLGHVHGRDTVVQGGGHLGLVPGALASVFHRVFTAEPDAANYECLQYNCRADSVVALNAAWGACGGSIDLARDRPANSGTHYVCGPGVIPRVPIDALGLRRCDLIALDVEGYEYYALLGAIKTISACRPTIVWERKRGQCERHGLSENQAADLLTNLRYRFVERIKLDEVWKSLSS